MLDKHSQYVWHTFDDVYIYITLYCVVCAHVIYVCVHTHDVGS